MDDPSDSELVACVRTGDLTAYDLLVARHCRRLRAFIALRAPVPHLIDEIAHDALRRQRWPATPPTRSS